MPRLAGQIDRSKSEAILDAAIEVFQDRGAAASMDEIARRASVSKQTVYNHYGSRAEVVRAVMERRVHEVTAGLDAPSAVERPAEALAEFGRHLLDAAVRHRYVGFMRMAMLSAPDMPDVAGAIYDAGALASQLRLAEYLRVETRAGRIACPDPLQAAEFFIGMVLGTFQTAALLGISRPLDAGEIDALAAEAAARFLKAYAP